MTKSSAYLAGIRRLIVQAEHAGLTDKTDRIYVFNKLLALLKVENYEGSVLQEIADTEQEKQLPSIPDLIDALAEQAVRSKLIEDLSDTREILGAELMDVFVDRPSRINDDFNTKFRQSPETATNWFYHLSQASNYIQTKRIARNISYQAATHYGDFDITINLSKPEKNPKDIAAAKHKKTTHYPACLLCAENEGYKGRIGHPARTNHRLIRLELGCEPWYLQYSPYVYYPEHCIVLSEKHRDMTINKQTFERLLEFVEKFPHYFIGSNADLPIVGGSILTHDHYQGGHYSFAMDRAKTDYEFSLPAFRQVSCGLVRWPMSVIRLRAEAKSDLVLAAESITNVWRRYADFSADIHPFTDQIPHNTVTPIARSRNNLFELDLVLRNNRQSEAHPLGIFHPHSDVHHIKKENIGLIEVMGLAVLPPRLVDELGEVEKMLQGKPAEIEAYHQEWADNLFARKGILPAVQAAETVRTAVAEKFEQVLEHAGVFKRDAAGQIAFRKFIRHLQDQADSTS